eukprot:TRINITY_DN14577_c0_g1_i1.p1 TRINITY_DN14577_c0_g1~~TRINITY_DN14577_c0_g1_i1.p1  ORF type:complete len:293 (+),score=44.73 TRINITY_DN14577_c0_g1_i1:41-919(+)
MRGRLLHRIEDAVDKHIDSHLHHLGKLEGVLRCDLDGDGEVGVCGTAGKYTITQLKKMSEEERDAIFCSQPFSEVAPYMGTGDVLLLHGTELFSAIIKSSTRSWYSHAAMVVREPPLEILQLYDIAAKPDPYGLYVFESDTETEDQRQGGGVQLLSLTAWIDDLKDYYKDFFFLSWRRLTLRPPHPAAGDPIRRAVSFPKFLQVLRDAHGRSYETKKPQLVAAVIRRNTTEDLSSIFCSELVAWGFEGLDLLPEENNASNWIPAMFSAIHSDVISTKIQPNGGYLEHDKRVK